MRPHSNKDKLQSKKDITVQCIDFCEITTTEVHAVSQRVPSELRGGTFRQHLCVLVATLCFQENPHRSLQIVHVAMCQVLRGAYVLLRVLLTTEAQLLVEIQQQPEVLLLKGLHLQLLSPMLEQPVSSRLMDGRLNL